MSRGIVASFSTTTGYGFIDDSDTGNSVFVHQRDLNMEGYRHLKIGEEVEYDTEEGERGHKAINVTLISERVEEDRGARRDNDRRGGDRGGYFDRNDRYDNRNRPRGGGYNRHDRDHRDHRDHRNSGPSWDDYNRLKEQVFKQKGIINRILEVLGSEDDDNDPILTKEEIHQIRSGDVTRESKAQAE